MFYLDLVKSFALLKSFDADTIVIHDNEEMGDQMYIILEGKAGVYKDYQKKKPIKLTELYPGDFFGEMTLFLNKNRTATVVALTDLRV